MEESKMKFKLKLLCSDCGSWCGNVGSYSIANIEIQCPRCRMGWG